MPKHPLLLKDLVAKCEKITTIGEAKEIIGDFSTASKMPCWSYSIPAEYCHTGTKLRGIKDSICSDCYACDNGHKSGWFTKDRVLQPMTHRLLQVLFNPRWTEAMIFLFQHYKWEFFRWHVDGDIQDDLHFERLCKIADSVPETKFWLPTQEWDIIINYWNKMGQIPLKKLHPNLIIRLSARMKDGHAPIWLAWRLGVATSRTSRKITDVDCPAHEHGDTCGDCRNCWNYDKMSVTYSFHETGEGEGINNKFTKKVMIYLEKMLLADNEKSKTEIYKEVSKHFSYPEIKIRILAYILKKRYRRRNIQSGKITADGKRGRPSLKLKIIQ